ncbi:MAG: GMC family oxidoreductase [Candidatus Brocadia sp.]|nr:GMC family oxidoreductase [Candidatus Brocadia sp.]
MPANFISQLSFTESMSGYINEGTENPEKGEKQGKAKNNTISMNARITIDSIKDFIEKAEHEAVLEGTLYYPPFGTNLKIEDGKFNLFILDRNVDVKKMQYRFHFTSQTTGKRYYFHGMKEIQQKLWDFLDPLDPIKDMTTLFTTIYEGDTERGKVVASGILRFNLAELPRLVASIEAQAPNASAKKKAVLDFFGFALGELGETYLPILFSRFMEAEDEYDAIVIGSGFGGSATAYKLSKAGKSVCILERGKRWRGKVNVKNVFDLVPMFRTPLNNGLFDYRIFKDIHVFQSNGVGGGSLIYANVIMRPEAYTFDKDWPQEITLQELNKYFPHVEKMLDIRKADAPPLPQLLPKTAALKKGAESTGEGQWQLLNLAIQPFDEVKNLGSCDEPVNEPSPCRACGNCVFVCNRSAKNTLDLNYLKEAIDHGAELFPEHEVTNVEPLDNGKKGYVVHYKDIKHGINRTVRGKKVIVAAGSLGSTELLLRCRQNGSLPDISPMLGKNFSGNGDLQAFAVNTNISAESAYGPTITSMIDFRPTQPLNVKFVAEEGGFPPSLVAIANALLPRLDTINNMPDLKDTIKQFLESDKKDVHDFMKKIFLQFGYDVKDNIMDTITSFAKEPVSHCLMYLVIGRDASNGRMRLEGDRLIIDWDPQESMPLFENMVEKLSRISREGLGGNFETNPLWSLFKILITVHPLGGCKMGNEIHDGVVNHKGEVFHYPNLYVADGSIFPKALGVNPSLTIAALAERNADIMLQTW